jgi:tRNA(Leu) C34 or U34 (ribose-2'-O)-methylase TrmL
MLQNIRIVLVETSHTGNMGSVARAMKTMGLTNLWLVNPLVKPDSQAIALAAGASDVIGNARSSIPSMKRWRAVAWSWGPARAPARCRGRCSIRANAA